MKRRLLDDIDLVDNVGTAIVTDWNQLKLKDCCTKITDGSHFSPKSVDRGYPYVTVKDIKNDLVDLKNCLKIATSDYEALVKNDCRPLLNDLLFSKDGTVGKVSLINTEENFVVLSSIAILRPNLQIIFPKYLFYVLKSREFLNQALNQKKGVAIRRIILRDLKELTLSVPTIAEQQQIVSKIEELFSELDKGIEELKTAQQQLKVYRQAVLKWAFEGKLTNKDVRDGELPKGWKFSHLGEIIEQPKYGTSKKCDYQKAGKGVLRIPNIQEGKVNDLDLKYADFDKDEIETYSLKEGDILTIRSNGSIDIVGKCALITKQNADYLYAGYLIRLRPIQSEVISRYLLHVISSSNLRTQIESKAKSTSGVNNINSDELKSLIVPICYLEEQQKVVQEIETRRSVCDKMEETITNSLKQAEALRQSILRNAFEGKL